jgi:hypothetical protein
MTDPESLSERIITPISPALVAAVDDYRYTNRIPSRAEAMRQLLQRGLASAPASTPRGSDEAPRGNQSTLSDLVLKYYAADPAHIKPLKEFGVKTAQDAAAFELVAPPRRKDRDEWALYAFVEGAKRTLEQWEDIDDPAAQAIAALLRPLTL